MRALLAGVLLVATAAYATRPGNEFQLFSQLNGQPVRWTLPDAGQAGMYAASGLACMTLKGGTVRGPGDGARWAFVPSTILLSSATPFNLCVRPAAESPYWDGGCSTTDTDENFGVPLQPNVPQYVNLESQATTLCAVSDAGVVRVTVWGVQ